MNETEKAPLDLMPGTLLWRGHTGTYYLFTTVGPASLDNPFSRTLGDMQRFDRTLLQAACRALLEED